MLWNVVIDRTNTLQNYQPTTVEAENWMSALKQILEKTPFKGQLLSRITCNLGANRRVDVGDPESGLRCTLMPLAVETSHHYAGLVPDNDAPELTSENRLIVAFEKIVELYELREPNKASQFVLDLALKLIDFEAGSCMLVSPESRNGLYAASVHGLMNDFISERQWPQDRGIIGFSINNNTVVNVTDPEMDSRFNAEDRCLIGVMEQNIIIAPMKYDGITIGVIVLVNRVGCHGFSADDANVLRYLASAFAEYVHTSLPSRDADFTVHDFNF